MSVAIAGFALFAFATLSLSAFGQSDRIVVDGSTGVTPLVQALASAYQAKTASASIHIGAGLGTKARIVALSEGRIDIAMASHGLDVGSLQRQGMVVHEIGKVPVVFAVNASVPVRDISPSQVCDVYAEKIRAWKELGGPDIPLIAVARPESEVDTEVVREKVPCFTKLKLGPAVRIAPKAPDMSQELMGTIGAIGMTTMTIVEQSGGKIRALSLAGIAPTAQNVQNGSYVLTRNSFLVTTGNPPPSVQRFLEFVRSAAGASVLAANGAIAVR